MNIFKDSVGMPIPALHNDYIEILVTQGVISLIFYLSFMLYSLKIIIKEYFIRKNKIFLITLLLIIYFFL